MGKRAGSRRAGRGGEKKAKEEWHNLDIPQENELFKAYYQLQLPMAVEAFEDFWSAMKRKLPVVFRVNPSCPNYRFFCAKIEHSQFIKSFESSGEIEKDEINPQELLRLSPLDWYPGQLVYCLSTTKQEFKKSAVLAGLHKYLQGAFDSGLIARQELVSMLPPLYLDVKPTDMILDMCAAPGSKTTQLLEMLYGERRALTSGCVIANDSDYSRAQMLIHQLNRAGTAGMAVIHHPGQMLPSLSNKDSMRKFYFDKVLCDVPCSGDGATRKLPLKWAKWHPSDGLGLHPLQLSILLRGVNLLKRGGLLVYSTCSLNPIENEAVVAALLAKVKRGLSLVDVHGMYGVKGQRGLLEWSVCGAEHRVEIQEVAGIKHEQKKRVLRVFNNYEEAKHDGKIKSSFFAPERSVAVQMGLDRTMRVLPNQQDSGGFFVALFRKDADFEWNYDVKKESQNQSEVIILAPKEDLSQKQEQEEFQELEQSEEEQKNGLQPSKILQKEKPSKHGKYEKFDVIKEEQFASIRDYYGIEERHRHLMYVRDAGQSRKVLLISEGVKSFLQAGDTRVNIVNMGCKIFQKAKETFAGHDCSYRLDQEGIHFLVDLMTKRKVTISHNTFTQLIQKHSLNFQDIQEEDRGLIREMGYGSFCLCVRSEGISDAVVAQNFRTTVNLMAGKDEVASLKLRYT